MKNVCIKYITYAGITFLYCILPLLRSLHAQELPSVSNTWPILIWKDTNTILSYIKHGQQLRVQQNKDSAERVLYTALQSSKQLIFVTGIKKALTELADVYTAQKKYDKAIDLYQQTILYCQDNATLETALPVMHNNLANVYLNKGNYEQALQHYQKAAALYDKLPVKNYGEIYNNLGGLLIHLRQYDQVLYYLHKAEGIAQKNNDITMLCSVYGNMGSYYFEKNQLDSSLLVSHKALTLSRQHNLTQVQFKVLANLAEIYRRAHKAEQAMP